MRGLIGRAKCFTEIQTTVSYICPLRVVSLPIAMQYGERLVLAPYQPLRSGFLISEIE